LRARAAFRAALGARTSAAAAAGHRHRARRVFLVMIPGRRWLARRNSISAGLVPAGAAIGF
jgi:hypothetical protein